jgi:hypothetical protein
MSDNYGHEVFRSRAIKPDVAQERGYRRYGAKNGLAPIFEADDRFRHPEEGGAQFLAPWDGRWHSFYNWSRHKVRGTTGWVMPKNALPGSAFDAPLAQLRPDRAIPGRRYSHDHSDMGDIIRVLHEEGKQHRDPDTGELLIPLTGVHEHVEQAKYVLAPGPYGKRWDTHPRCTAEAFQKASRVFLHLEGCLKLDALVSVGEVGADVPSVTLWDRRPDEVSKVDFTQEADDIGDVQANDLLDFLAAHVDAPVIIVCDSDWKRIPAVATEAFSLRDVVRDAGLPCVVAAPPEGRYLRTDRLGRRIHKKIGSDDFQYAGGTVDELIVAEPIAALGLVDFERTYRRDHSHGGLSGRRRPRKTIEFELDLLRWYTLHSTSEGLIERQVGTIARRLGVGRDRVRAATLRLEQAGALDIDGYYDDPAKRPKRTAEDWKAINEDRKERRARQRAVGERPDPTMIQVRADLRPEFQTPRVGDVAPT